jgi:hypothetical protein
MYNLSTDSTVAESGSYMYICNTDYVHTYMFMCIHICIFIYI